MEPLKKHITAAQVTAMVDFMKENADNITGLSEAQWRELKEKLNSMGGAVKSTEQWKKTWSYLKWSNKNRGPHRTMKHPRSSDKSGMSSSNKRADTQDIDDDHKVPVKKRQVSFDEELVNIERDKLELEREYKIQKVEALCRIAAALENLANKS